MIKTTDICFKCGYEGTIIREIPEPKSTGTGLSETGIIPDFTPCPKCNNPLAHKPIKNDDDISKELIKKAWREIDRLIAHWIGHMCPKCDTEPRYPTKAFPNIMKLGQELRFNE